VASASLVDVMNKTKHFARYLVHLTWMMFVFGFCFDAGRETKVTAPKRTSLLPKDYWPGEAIKR